MKKLLPFLKPYTKEAIISPLFKLLEAGFDLLVPLAVKSMIDIGIANSDKPYIWMMCGVLVLLALVGLTCSLIAQYFAAKAAVGFSGDLRSALFRHIQKFSYEQTDTKGTSTLITRMTADINQMQSGLNLFLRLFLRSPIIVFGAMIMAFTVNVSCAWIFAVVIPLLFAVVFGIMFAGVPLYKKVQKNLDAVTSRTRENLNGVRVIRAFCKESSETEKFDESNTEHNRMQNFVGRISALLNPLTLLLVNGGLIFLLLAGGDRVNKGTLTTGEVFALTSYMAQILTEIVKLANTIITVNKGLACASRVEDVLYAEAGMSLNPQTQDDCQNGQQETSSESAVEFSNVSLIYKGNSEPSVSHVNLRVSKGQTVGIIGSTGSGKTSLIQLIPRFYDATEGTVTVNGQNVQNGSLESLRSKIGIVPQKAILFRGTVRSNLLWGNGAATDEDLWEALEQAQAKSFIEQSELGLDAPVAQNGKNFSGGQRQRLTIARALVRKPEILILDDASSALDFATDAALRSAVRALPYHPTVFLISQRAASLRYADQILVLEDGEQVGLGTHDTLLKSCEVYREIYESQFREGGDGK